jgi:hypothetical protein
VGELRCSSLLGNIEARDTGGLALEISKLAGTVSSG